MATQVYLIRHGETLWNAEKRLQGQLDSPLTEEGIQQALLLANRLSATRFDAVYSSDLGRALHTTEIITAKLNHVTVTCDPRIRERHFGCFQGLTWEEIKERFPEEAVKDLSGNPSNRVPGGESKHQMLSRVQDFFKDMILRHENGKVLVVSHGGMLNIWTRYVLHIPLDTPRRFHLDNATINVFEYYDDRWYLRTLGEMPSGS